MTTCNIQARSRAHAERNNKWKEEHQRLEAEGGEETSEDVVDSPVYNVLAVLVSRLMEVGGEVAVMEVWAIPRRYVLWSLQFFGGV